MKISNFFELRPISLATNSKFSRSFGLFCRLGVFNKTQMVTRYVLRRVSLDGSEI